MRSDSLNYTSRPIASVKEDLSHRTLGEALEELLPEYFETGSGDNSNIGETASVSAAGTQVSEDRQSQACPSLSPPTWIKDLYKRNDVQDGVSCKGRLMFALD